MRFLLRPVIRTSLLPHVATGKLGRFINAQKIVVGGKHSSLVSVNYAAKKSFYEIESGKATNLSKMLLRRLRTNGMTQQVLIGPN